MTNNEKAFIRELETVSVQLAVWAQEMITKNSWAVVDVKLHLRNCAKIAGRS